MNKEEEMQRIISRIKDCRKCDLWKSRLNPVPGEGSLDAEILFIGEAPGYNEDKQGRPFVGRAGKILDELLESIGIDRSKVYIANILKCRPPDNRDPDVDEINACIEYLDRQIEIIQPKIISPLGRFACEYIFKKYGLKYDKISKMHGKIFKVNTLFGSISIIPLYHPAVATYNPMIKNQLLEDFKTIKTSELNIC
ncbi:MAG: uracil-DNA glycosylase [Thermoplasmata archaeon]|nr:MAG: uracil-DNA glycosylase [Thermoplasmata archaeon]